MKKSCSFGLFGLADRAVRSLVPSYPVCVVSWIWNLIVSVPDHCPFILLFIFMCNFIHAPWQGRLLFDLSLWMQH